MRCGDCVNFHTEEQVAALDESVPRNARAKRDFNDNKDKVVGHLKRGEKVGYCPWVCFVTGSKSVCADIEVKEETKDE